MEKEYILVIFDEDNNIKDYYFGENMKEIEEKLYKIIDKNINFEIYHAIDTKEMLELTMLAMKRYIESM